MSIQSNMDMYMLSEYTRFEDELGTVTEDYKDIKGIQVSISHTNMTEVSNGIVYNITQPQGVTRYKDFDRGTKYRLEGDGVYDIESVNTAGRYTQLVLKEVII